MNKDLLLLVESVSNEKNISKEAIFTALEQAVTFALKKKTSTTEFLIKIDRKTGILELLQVFKVVDIVTNSNLEISSKDSGLEVGEVYIKALGNRPFDRITTQIAKQVIFQKVREAERKQCLEQKIKLLKKLVSGTVKEVYRDYIIVDLGWKADAILRKVHMLPKENFRVGERVRALLYSANYEGNGPIFHLSRNCDDMLRELLSIEVPEINDGLLEIKSVSREPGVRSKLAILSKDKRLDPVGACVGMKGARIQSISSELKGEKIDIVIWDDNPVQYVINSMSPTTVLSMIMDEDEGCMDIAVAEHELSQAIGKNGQNVKLASSLTGWKLNILGINEFLYQKEQESNKLCKELTNNLDISDDLASIFIEAGYTSLQDIADISEEEIIDLESDNLKKDEIYKVRDLAKLKINDHENIIKIKLKQDIEMLIDKFGLNLVTSEELINKFILNNINKLSDIAESSVDELLCIINDKKICGNLIMASREHCWLLDGSQG